MMDYEHLEEDKNIINNAYFDIVVLYLNGSVKISKHKPMYKGFFNNDETCQNIGYYKLFDGESELKYLYYDKLPTDEKPSVIKDETLNVVLFPYNKSTLHIINDAGGPKNLAEKYLTDQIKISDVGLKYRFVNLSDRQLYLANFGKVETLPNESPERLKAYLWEFDLVDEYESLKDRYDLVIKFTTTTSMKLNKNNVKSMDIIWFEKENISGPLRPKDEKVDDISVFCSWSAANDFLNEYKNTRNYIISKTADYFDQEKEDAVKEQKVSNKKDMIALAKVCAAFVASGIIYAAVKLLIDKFFPAKEIFNGLMYLTKNEIDRKLATGILVSGEFLFLMKILEKINKYTHFKEFKDKIDTFIEKIPLVGRVYKGIKYVNGRLFSDEDSFLNCIIVDPVKRVVSNVIDSISAGLFNVVAFVFRF